MESSEIVIKKRVEKVLSKLRDLKASEKEGLAGRSYLLGGDGLRISVALARLDIFERELKKLAVRLGDLNKASGCDMVKDVIHRASASVGIEFGLITRSRRSFL
jgi:hypothetical protein